MTISHGHQRAKLFNWLLEKARKHEACLTFNAMKYAFEFENDDQLRDALDRLVESGHITFDIDGRYPAIRIWKSGYRFAGTLLRPYYLRPGNAKDDHQEPPVPESVAVVVGEPEPVRCPAPGPSKAIIATAEEPVREAETTPKAQRPKVDPPKVMKVAQDTADSRASKRTHVVTVRLTKDEQDWMEAQLEARSDPIALPGLCRELLAAEIDRRRNPPADKMHIPAALVRGAIDARMPVYDFVAQMALVGLHAKEMNLRGV